MQSLELLAPAKNLECGIAAIGHGADAVYIGAERFGARQSAGNPVEDIAELCKYAHTFKAKVYVTVNTIIYDDETAETERLIKRLYDAGVDAILVQDMGILEMDLPPIPIHASTQTDNRSAEKIGWLASHGFKRAVLARELSLKEIEEIHKAVPDMELEAFVHGALCVSYSGQCYASQYCFSRSANRGECAQFCRLKFDLEDADGNVIKHGRHLLSLKDLCRIDYLEEMAHAGITSFKIEGRLKDISYVKNVTAAYSRKLDEIIKHNPGTYRRASLGVCKYTFTPDLDKTFNRGYTDYFLLNGQNCGRTNNGKDIVSLDTPKAIGEYVGRVKEIKSNSFTVAGTASFNNGDGLCFFCEQETDTNDNGYAGDNRTKRGNPNRKLSPNTKQKGKALIGFRVNKAEGNRIFPHNMPHQLKAGTLLYRNNDKAFEDMLAKHSATRKIPIKMNLDMTDNGFRLTLNTESGEHAEVTFATEMQKAQKPQRENIIKQLTKLGNTPFECSEVTFSNECFNYFIPSSILAENRREATSRLIDELSKADRQDYVATAPTTSKKEQITCNEKDSWQLNVSNGLARRFYEKEGLHNIQYAFELKRPASPLLMQCRHCIRRSLGHCKLTDKGSRAWHEPLYLKLPDGRKFRLKFDCNKCNMNVYAES